MPLFHNQIHLYVRLGLKIRIKCTWYNKSSWFYLQKADENNNVDPHYQWVHNDTQAFLMFSSDMCLSKDVQPDVTGRYASPMNIEYVYVTVTCWRRHQFVTKF